MMTILSGGLGTFWQLEKRVQMLWDCGHWLGRLDRRLRRWFLAL